MTQNIASAKLQGSFTRAIRVIHGRLSAISLIARIKIGIALTCLLILTITSINIWSARNEALEVAGNSTSNRALLLQQHVADVMAMTRMVMSALPEDSLRTIASGPEHDRLTATLAKLTDDMPMLLALRVIDTESQQQLFAFDRLAFDRNEGIAHQPVIFAAEEYAFAHSPELHVSRLYRGANPGQWLANISRTVASRYGKSVLVAVVDLAEIHKMFAGTVAPVGSTSTLYRDDGTILVRYPDGSQIGSDHSSANLFQTILKHAENGNYRAVSSVDGIERLVSYRSLPDVGLVVVDALDINKVLANWFANARNSINSSIISCVFIFLLGRYLLSSGKRNAAIAQKLKSQTQMLESTLDNMDQGLVMVDADGRVAVSNQRFAEMLEIDREFMRSRPHHTELRRVMIKAGEFSNMDAQFQQWVATEDLAAREQVYTRTRPNGTTLEVRTKMAANGGAVRTYTDVTARQSASVALAASEARYRLLADTASDLVILANADRSKVYISPAVTRMLGFSVEEATAMKLREFVHPDDIDMVFSATKSLCAAQPMVSINYRLRRCDGTYLWAEANLQRVAEDDGRSIVLSIRDVSARHDAQVALAQKSAMLAATLENMAQGLIMVDGERRVQVCNRRALDLLDLPAEFMAQLPSVEEVEDFLALDAASNGSHANAGDFDFTRFRYESVRPDGRILEIRTTPMVNQGFIRTFSDISRRKAAESHIARVARHDLLTDLPNRLLFRERLDQAIADVGRNGGMFSVLCLDLDRFKPVNDTLGHAIGDKLLRAVAERLRAVTRAEDIVARLGGDEFAIIQTGVDQPHHAGLLADRIIETINHPFDIDGNIVSIGTSIGVSIAPHDGMSLEALMRHADLALYRAKADGRSVHRFFQTEMDAEVETRRALEFDLRLALKNGEFELLYQPVICLTNGRISACEALLRWNHPVRGLISPSTFIPMAEEMRLIGQIGEWVLREACNTLAQWPQHISMGINLSAAQFGHGSLVTSVVSALAKSGVAPNRLELEITETALMQQDATVYDALRQLRELGVRIALDDFGTGYSSLSYLRRFPLDTIKIDRSFMAEIADPKSALIVRAIVGLGKQFGMKVTAEGIETQAHLDFAIAEGCSHAQGYLFSHALSRTAIEAQLEVAQIGMAA